MAGVDAAIGMLLLAFQGLALLILAAQSAFGRRWAALSGLLAGFLIGLGPRIFNLFNTPLFLLSSTVLVVSYAFARRWIALGLVIAIFYIPLSWFFFSRSESPKIFTLDVEITLYIIGYFGFTPIACALACQEIFVWARRRAANRARPDV